MNTTGSLTGISEPTDLIKGITEIILTAKLWSGCHEAQQFCSNSVSRHKMTMFEI
jgi:hypothetical protein